MLYSFEVAFKYQSRRNLKLMKMDLKQVLFLMLTVSIQG